MEVRAVKNLARSPFKDNPGINWIKMPQWFQRGRFSNSFLTKSA